MRSAAFAGLAVVMFAPQVVTAQQTPYLAVVTDPEVKIRAAPSDRLDDTGSLRQGDQVIVERELSDGWLAITAPAGSVSWVAYSFIEVPGPEDRPTPKHGVVCSVGEITLAAGKVGENQPLNIRREKIPDGSDVTLIGPPVEFSGKKWWPIVPPPGDVRYIPKTAVRTDKLVNSTYSVRVTDTGGTIPPAASLIAPPTGAPLATVPGPGSVTPAGGGVTVSKPAVNHPLWTQAETAERDGRIADAEKAYFELAALMNGPAGDHDIANLCYTRIHALREKKRNASGNRTPPTLTTPSVLQPPSRSDRGVRSGAPQPLATTASNTAATTASNTTAGAGTNRVNTSGESGGNTNNGGAQWNGPGRLSRSALTPDGTGRPAYILESTPGVVKMYVIGGSGVDLEKYLGKRVDVYGVPQTRRGLSKQYVVATSVELAP